MRVSQLKKQHLWQEIITTQELSDFIEGFFFLFSAQNKKRSEIRHLGHLFGKLCLVFDRNLYDSLMHILS